MDTSKTTEELKDALEKEKQNVEDRYSQILDNLDYEKTRIQNEIRREFRTARRYVRANPEIGVGAAFASGVLVGAVIVSIFRN